MIKGVVSGLLKYLIVSQSVSDALELVELASPWWYVCVRLTSAKGREREEQEAGRSIDPEQPERP